MSQIFINIFFATISLLFVLAWAVFFFFYSPRKTTPAKIIFVSFVLGIGAVCLAFLIELIFSSFTRIDIFFLQYLFKSQNSIIPYLNLLISVFFFAAIEEAIKFVFLRQYFKTNEVNQVVDGVKIGVWLGLGFAFVENTFYFLNFYSQFSNLYLLAGVISLRGIFSTLAHPLYGAIMGYYLSLAKFNKFYRFYFLQKGFIINVFIHGFFNFFLVINLGFLSVVILIYILLVALILYNTKKNLIKYEQLKDGEFVSPSFISDRIELETILSKRNAPAEYFRQLLKIFPKENRK